MYRQVDGRQADSLSPADRPTCLPPQPANFSFFIQVRPSFGIRVTCPGSRAVPTPPLTRLPDGGCSGCWLGLTSAVCPSWPGCSHLSAGGPAGEQSVTKTCGLARCGPTGKQLARDVTTAYRRCWGDCCMVNCRAASRPLCLHVLTGSLAEFSRKRTTNILNRNYVHDFQPPGNKPNASTNQRKQILSEDRSKLATWFRNSFVTRLSLRHVFQYKMNNQTQSIGKQVNFKDGLTRFATSVLCFVSVCLHI